MLTLIIKSILLLFIPISIGSFIFSLIKERKKHRNFNKWMDFQEKVREISQEADQVNRIRIMEYLLSIMPNNAEEGAKKYKHIQRYRKEIYEKFGDYIPTFKREYLAEIRDKKIDEILK